MIEEITIFFQIILIDLVLAGDNAIIIGMVASQFKQNLRKKIIFWGIAGAIVLRIFFTFITVYLLQIDGLRTVGGILLLYICFKLYKNIIKNKESNIKKIEAANLNFYKAILTVIIADLTMSLDNVLGVAGAAGKHWMLLIFGLALSIILMATIANIISSWIKKYKLIGYLGLIAILMVSIQLIIGDYKSLQTYF